MMSVVVGLAGLLVSQWAFAQAATIAVGTPLKILDGQPEQITIKTAKGPVTITRKMTACGKNGGVMQPLVPVKGVHPVAEIEVIAALGDADAIVLDMRDTNDRVKGTIPGSVGIPYTEVASRMNELGCTKTGAKWNCAKAKKVYAFCNGPACPQSPMAIRAMTRDGFPADKIYYYRGGMLDWDALGLTSVKDEF
ncbi:MAG: rhodanese-like domain-containing protein [Burkholderiaceae bacterium]